MEKEVFIMRGIPGSGKSTLARTLASAKGGIFAIHSTDSYFFVNGRSEFDGTKLHEYHARNLVSFRESLLCGIPLVICDNCNVEHWEYVPYVKSAEEFGYDVRIFPLPHISPRMAAKYSTHGVPEATIRKMLAKWQD